MFVNRVRELELLEQRFNSGKAELFVLYGRRRVGKTELLTHFCRGKRAVFFVADLGSELSLRSSLSKTINNVLYGEQSANATYDSWEDLFNALAKAAQSERLILVLDEFPYLVSGNSSLASLLQRVWDSTLKHTQLMLVLCGSYIGMMEETVLGYKAPLYGRRTAQYLLEPLLFQDAAVFYAKYKPEEKVRTYAIFGGTPAYLNQINENVSLAENIRQEILTRGAYLYDEVRFVLQQELREPRNYFAILQAIASGKTKLNEIKQATGVEGATAYLDTLQQLQLIERIVPVTDTQPHKSRMGLYRLKDQYLRFWFRYVHPNRSQLEQGNQQFLFDSKIVPEIDDFTSQAFEEICRQFFWRINQKGVLPFQFNNIGRWWHTNEEIDLVGVGEKDLLLVECKWTAKPVGIDVLKNLENKVRFLGKVVKDKRIAFAFCARSGFTNEMDSVAFARKDIKLFNLSEIIGE